MNGRNEGGGRAGFWVGCPFLEGSVAFSFLSLEELLASLCGPYFCPTVLASRRLGYLYFRLCFKKIGLSPGGFIEVTLLTIVLASIGCTFVLLVSIRLDYRLGGFDRS